MSLLKTRLMSVVVLTCAAMALPVLPAAAADFTPPQGCTMRLTVQTQACMVSNYYICKGDPAGTWHSRSFDSDGPFYDSTTDSEYQWIESRTFSPDMTTRLERSKDPASLSNMLKTGVDTYDFLTRDDTGAGHRYSGYDRLTGEKVVIDGVTLEVTEFELTESTESGSLVSQRSGHQYVDRGRGLFLSGVETMERSDGERVNVDGSPVKFIKSGQPGFASTVPLFGCDGLMSLLAPPSGGAHG